MKSRFYTRRLPALALFGGLVLAPTVPAAAATSPQAVNTAFGIPFFSAQYALKKLGLTVAKITVSFGRENGRLIYRQVTLPAGVITWFRHDRITEESLLAPGPVPLPTEYRFLHTGDGPTKQAVIHFDRQTDEASGHMQNGDPVKVAIDPGTLDRLSLQLALMQAVAKGQKTLRFTTVETKNKLSHYDFHDLGHDTVMTPLGQLDTLHLQRVWQAKHIRFDFWLAPSLHDLPVKLIQTDGDGASLGLYLQSVRWY
ncbi:hypothetical protein BI364_12145 [Acidihalobacter yilgarnensis]|uniref:DUF3108 domain-containing protein n=1 Tax=Acidihalobacter yilgarnensis TaxID=2819280 RepID=A0A1D8IQ76_9GAMM|nr:DUF3108 domain-containing protein [Acidihalobacter yilgarnensis]AOU98609.1 hypothetical protein BI364_12145 [Acidihalobacter yilgarnensis]